MRDYKTKEIKRLLEKADFTLVILFNDDQDGKGYNLTTLYPREQDSPEDFEMRLNDAINQLTEIRDALSELMDKDREK